MALVRNTFLAIAGLWAVTVASFLQVFVPQQCQPLPAGYVSPWFGAFPAGARALPPLTRSPPRVRNRVRTAPRRRNRVLHGAAHLLAV